MQEDNTPNWSNLNVLLCTVNVFWFWLIRLQMPQNKCLRLWVGCSPWNPLEMLPSDRHFKPPLPRKSYAVSPHGDVPTKVSGRRWIPSALHRVDWSLVIMIPNQPQEDCKAYGCMLTGFRDEAGVLETQNVQPHPKSEWTEQSATGPKCNSDRPAALWFGLFVQRLGVGSTLKFSLGIRVVPSPPKTDESRWMADVEMEIRRNDVLWTPHIFFFFSFFAHYFYPPLWFRRHTIRNQSCKNIIYIYIYIWLIPHGAIYLKKGRRIRKDRLQNYKLNNSIKDGKVAKTRTPLIVTLSHITYYL